MMPRAGIFGPAVAIVILAAGCWPFDLLPSGSAPRTPTPPPVASPAPAPIPASPPPEPLVDPEALVPYFDNVGEGMAARALADDNLEEARRLFDDLAVTLGDQALQVRARLVAALVAAKLGDDERAVSELPELASLLPEVAAVALETAAESALRLGRNDLARTLATAVREPGAARAELDLVLADAARQSKQLEDAARRYDEFAGRYPGHGRRSEAVARIIECRARQLIEGDTVDPTRVALALEGLAVLRAQAPSDFWTRHAEGFEPALLGALGLPPPVKPTESRAARDAFDRASELARKMRHREAELAFRKTIELAQDDGRLACRARVELATSVERQRERARAGGLFEDAVERCTEPDLRVRALYFGARAYQSAERFDDAIRLFAAVEREFPAHSYADDARLHAAECVLAQGDLASGESLLFTLPDAYPTGDMRSEALWLLAKSRIEEGRVPEARPILQRYHELFPREEGWYTAGRGAYWLGRATELAGDLAEAMALYEEVLAAAPLGFYMVLAHARLATLDRPRATLAMRRLAPLGGESVPRFPRRLLSEYPGLATGIELARLGFLRRARQELDLVTAEVGARRQVLWIVADLYRRQGRFEEARELTVRSAAEWSCRYPAGDDLAAWSLAYPRAFAEEVATAAARHQVPEALIWAVMREESGFNARVESWANAIGLMQLIMPTARRIGAELGVTITPATLRQPATNINVGAAYLAKLLARFSGHPALAIAGYNAGEGAVVRWLRSEPRRELDLFVERIPYGQTRGYTKRVLASYAVYTFLGSADRPVVEPPFQLPVF